MIDLPSRHRDESPEATKYVAGFFMTIVLLMAAGVQLAIFVS